MLLIALTHVRIKQRARTIIYYILQSILEILSRTPSHTNLGSRFTNTYLRNIIIAKSFLPTLAHVYTSIYPITLSSLNSCQPYFTDTILIHSVLLSSLSFLHELYFTDSIPIYPITLSSLKVSYTNSYTISNFLQLKVINMSTISYICLYLFIYLFILLFIYIIYYYYIILYYTSNLKKLLKDFFDFRYIICIS